MNEHLDQRKINPIDSIVDSYRESLKVSFTSEKSLPEKPLLQVKSQSDVSQLRVKNELDSIRNNFLNAISTYELEFQRLQKSHEQISQQIDQENRVLNELYSIKATAETLVQLQKDFVGLERKYKENYARLQDEFELKQIELAQYIGSERKQFEEQMFERRRQWEAEIDSLDIALQRRKKECDLAERELEKEIHQKRRDWSREESLLEKEYHQKRLRFDQQMAEYESSFENKTRIYREKEISLKDDILRKEQELQRKLVGLEEKKQKLEAEVYALEKQIMDKRNAEDDAFFSRKVAFEKELEVIREVHEKELLRKQNGMMDEYLAQRDSVADQKHKEEKDKLLNQLSEFKARIRAQQKSVDDANSEKNKIQDQYRREIERYQKELTDLALRGDVDKKQMEAQIREKLEKEFYMKLQEVEVIYTQEISELKRYNQTLESQLNQERSVVKRMETGLRQSDIQAEQLFINSLENQQKFSSNGTGAPFMRTQRIVRPSRFKEMQ